MAAGLIARDMQVAKLQKINTDWWQENVKWSYQDQISLPYVLWKNNYGYDKMNLCLWQNDLFDLLNHNR
jgi:hypothetical protein